VESIQAQVLNYHAANGEVIMGAAHVVNSKTKKEEIKMVPVTYAKNYFFTMRLKPHSQDPLPNWEEVHQVNLISDADGYLALHRHTYYHVEKGTDKIIAVNTEPDTENRWELARLTRQYMLLNLCSSDPENSSIDQSQADTNPNNDTEDSESSTRSENIPASQEQPLVKLLYFSQFPENKVGILEGNTVNNVKFTDADIVVFQGDLTFLL
jgi:hypothetical protein